MTNKNKSDDTFLLLMPSFNEEKRIEETIRSWTKIIDKVPGSEILIVDGNSEDKTRKIIRRLKHEYKYISLINKKREGYGKDLLAGYKKAIKSKHKYIFQTDTDSPFETKDFFKLWNKRHTSPFIVGERHIRKDALYRLLLAYIIEIWVTILFGRRIKDPNIPFRLISRKYLKEILDKVPQSTIAPNIYLTIIASLDEKQIHHIPVKHYLRKNGHNKTRLLFGAFKGFFELIVFAIFKI